MRACVRSFVCVCVRACVRVCVRARVHVFVCVRSFVREAYALLSTQRRGTASLD